MKKIAAPIDEKNVSTDWIEDVFDNLQCTENGNMALGFIDGCPVYAYWFSNVLFWQFINGGSAGMEELRQRLSEFEDPESNLFSEIDKTGNTLVQRFYFKEDD